APLGTRARLPRRLADHLDDEPARRAAGEAPPIAGDGALLPWRPDGGAAVERGARPARPGDRLPPALLRGPRRLPRVERLPVCRRAADDELGVGAGPAPRAHRADDPRPLPRRLDPRGAGGDRRPRSVRGARGRTRRAGGRLSGRSAAACPAPLRGRYFSRDVVSCSASTRAKTS